MSETSPRVFLSVGTKRSNEQDQFITALDALLSNAGFETRRAQWSAINPLAKIKEEMNGCDGAVMIAFERIYAKEGRERSAPNKFVRLMELRFTTVWNHVEAAMAYCLELPLFIVCEPNLREEGLLEKFDWYIHRTLLSEETTREPEFLGIFQDWADRVRKHHATQKSRATGLERERLRADSLTVGEILKSLTVPQVVGLVSATLGVLATTLIVGSNWPELAKFLQ